MIEGNLNKMRMNVQEAMAITLVNVESQVHHIANFEFYVNQGFFLF